jgi:hypothetical protein
VPTERSNWPAYDDLILLFQRKFIVTKLKW